MTQIRIVFDPSLKVDARRIAELWADDPEARELLAGPPEVHRDRPAIYDLPAVVEYVVIPLAINVASSILIAVTTRLYQRYRPDGGARATVPEVAADQDRTVVIQPDEADPRP